MTKTEEYKGYDGVSRNLLQNYSKLGLTTNEVMFILVIMSYPKPTYKEKWLFNNFHFGMDKKTITKVKKHLVELGLLKICTIYKKGTYYFIQGKNLAIFIGDIKGKITLPKKKEVTIKDESEEELEKILMEFFNDNEKVVDLSPSNKEVCNKVVDLSPSNKEVCNKVVDLSPSVEGIYKIDVDFDEEECKKMVEELVNEGFFDV